MNAKGEYSPNFSLTEPEWALLLYLEHGAYIGHGYLCAASKERNKLRNLGLIVSGPTNPHGVRATGGKGKRWRPTDEGHRAAEWITRVRREWTVGNETAALHPKPDALEPKP